MVGESNSTVAPSSYVLLVLGSVSYFLFLFVWFLLPAFLTAIATDLGLSNTQAGLVTGAIQLIYIPMALISGIVIDRIGARNAIFIGIVLFGVGHGLRSGVTEFPALLAYTLLLGIGGTGVTFGLPKLVSELFPSERIGSASSVYVIGSSLGTATAFGLGRPVLGPIAGGWRQLFLLTGVGVTSFAVIWFAASRFLWNPVADLNDDSNAAFTIGSIRRDIGKMITHRQLRLLILIGTVYLFVNHGLQAWLAPILEFRGLSAGLAATITSLFVMARIVGAGVIPPLSDRLAARREAVAVCGTLIFLGLGGAVLSGTRLLLTVGVIALVGFGIGGLSTLIRAIPIEFEGIGPTLIATATGLIFTIGEIGGFAGPAMIGVLQDLTGSSTPGLLILAIGGMVIVVVSYLMDEPAGSSTSDATVQRE